MRELLLSVEKTKKPKYQALADGIRAAIRQGKVKPGERLPSSRDLARQFEMHRHTVMTALSELESEGWIKSQEKKFYQVTDTLPDTFLRARPVVKQIQTSENKEIHFARAVDMEEYTALTGYKHAFPSGFPDLRLFPLKEFQTHVLDALHSRDVLTYGNPLGHPKLIDQVTHYLRRVRNVDGREIIITNGSQEALFFLAQSLISPGDRVAVEALGYPPAMEAIKYAGATLVPISVDQEGLRVDELETKLKKDRIKFLYVTPLHQYPTTVTLSASRRLKLYELAIKHGIFIIEDDYDHEFHYASQPVAPLASFDPAGIVLYISTFSKILFPSARVGFMAVPKKVAREIAKLKRISSRQNEQILQVTIGSWMQSGGFEKHLRKMRRTYEERKNSIVGDLLRFQKKHPEISWNDPDGGMALWLDIGQESTKFSEKAKKRSVLVSPEQLYRIDKKMGTHLRLGFSGYSSQENRASLGGMFGI